MKPVYSPTDINNFKLSNAQKEFILNNRFSKKELQNHLKGIKSAYYATCKPVGFI